MMEQVILVDPSGKEIGVKGKLEAHREGNLHRAFSVFVFNSRNELLLQRREMSKYHSGGLWTNTCDGHPRPGERLEDAAHRRLEEEMGFDCPLETVFDFIYRTELDHGLIEHEYNYILVGKFDREPTPDPKEVDSWKWIALEALQKDVRENPDRYTYWFKVAFDKIMADPRFTSS